MSKIEAYSFIEPIPVSLTFAHTGQGVDVFSIQMCDLPKQNSAKIIRGIHIFQTREFILAVLTLEG